MFMTLLRKHLGAYSYFDFYKQLLYMNPMENHVSIARFLVLAGFFSWNGFRFYLHWQKTQLHLPEIQEKRPPSSLNNQEDMQNAWIFRSNFQCPRFSKQSSSGCCERIIHSISRESSTDCQHWRCHQMFKYVFRESNNLENWDMLIITPQHKTCCKNSRWPEVWLFNVDMRELPSAVF